MKRFSIITISLNCLGDLKTTFDSVVKQDRSLYEYIVIDGGSEDGTKAFLKKADDSIDYWVSEKDKGIYDAMNKGIQKATGETLIFLNAGDFFVGNVLNETLTSPGYIPVKYRDWKNRLVNVSIRSFKNGMPYCHQGMLFKNTGTFFSMDYTISSDYDFMVKNGFSNQTTIQSCDGYVYYDNHGLSAVNYRIRDKEITQIIRKHFGNFTAVKFQIKQFIKSMVKVLIGNSIKK